MGSQLAHWIKTQSVDTVVGFFDDGENEYSEKRILGRISEIEEKKSLYDYVIIGVGYNHLAFKRELGLRLIENSIPLYRFIHPMAFIDSTVLLGEGIVIFPGCVIERNVVLDNQVILNSGCVISHDSVLGESTFLGPNVTIAGNCKLGRDNYIGVGSIFRDGIQTVDKIQTGAGSVVVSDLMRPGLYLGCPATRVDKK